MNTPEKVDDFFVNKIQFPLWKESLAKDKLEFIKILMQRMQFHSYFHNLIMASTPQSERKSPTLEDSIHLISNGLGGVCFHQNGFITFLLQSLGFDAFMSSGNCLGSTAEGDGNHCMCILKLSEEEFYAIDIGCGQPVDEPIPLNKLPYKGVVAGFRYEYRYNPKENVYERWQFDGTCFRGPFTEEDKSQLRYKFTLKPKDSSYFEGTLLDIVTNPGTSIFLQSPFLFRCLDIEAGENTKLENGRKYILMFGASMVIYDSVNREVTDFSSYLEMKEDILKYFPTIDSRVVQQALEYFTSHDSPLVLGRVA